MIYKEVFIRTDEYLKFASNAYFEIYSLLDNNDKPINFTIVKFSNNKLFGSNIFGSIYIYMNNIINSSNNDLVIKNTIMKIIIHESMHTSQKINIEKYNIDKEYALKIEYECERRVSEFLDKNKNILSSKLNIMIL